jgi:hypothetical protein
MSDLPGVLTCRVQGDDMCDTCSEASSTSGVSPSFISSLEGSPANSKAKLVAQVTNYERQQHPTKPGKKQTVFVVRVSPPPASIVGSAEARGEWRVSRTYHDFEELHRKLRAGAG